MLSFAFLVVGMSVALTTWVHVPCLHQLHAVSGGSPTPTQVLLYVFNLKARGWQWPHGALFAAMLGSTDCVAVSALLKSGAPRGTTQLLAFQHGTQAVQQSAEP